MKEIMIQAIGFIAMAMYIVSYQVRSNKKLFLLQMIGCTLFLLQYFLLGAYTGVICLVVTIIRDLLLLRIDEWKWVQSKATMVTLIAIVAIMTVFTWEGPTSLLPFASFAVTSVGYLTNNAQHIRLSQMFGSPCSLMYDVVAGSLAGIMNESIVLVSILISIHRFGWKNLAGTQAAA